MRLPEILLPKPQRPLTGTLLAVARKTAGNQVRDNGFAAFDLGTYVIQGARLAQNFFAVGAFVVPALKDLVPKSGLSFPLPQKPVVLVDVVHIEQLLGKR